MANQLLKELQFYLPEWRIDRPSESLKRTSHGVSQYFQVRVLTRSGRSTVVPGVMVRIDVIEDIYHRTSGVEAAGQRYTWTIGTTVAGLRGVPSRDVRLEFATDAEREQVVHSLATMMKTVALPYFEAYSSVEAIDQLLNEKTQDPKVEAGGRPHRFFIGLIAGCLMKRRDMKALVSEYERLVGGLDNGFYLPHFFRLVADLRSRECQGLL